VFYKSKYSLNSANFHIHCWRVSV